MAINHFIPVNLRLPKNLINDSDRLAEQEGTSRSELVRNALRSYIERRQKLRTAYAIVERRGKASGINTPEDIERALVQVRAEHRSE